MARGLIEVRANATNSTTTSTIDASRPPVYKVISLTLVQLVYRYIFRPEDRPAESKF
jgi:hypothetical protein